jgi:DNA damage-binding protein 1
LITYNPTTASLVVTSALPLTPPTPSLRQAEFFSSVIANESIALVSLWVGVLSCIEMEIEKDADTKRRRSSAAVPEGKAEGKKLLTFRDNFNIKYVLGHASLTIVSESTTCST